MKTLRLFYCLAILSFSAACSDLDNEAFEETDPRTEQAQGGEEAGAGSTRGGSNTQAGEDFAGLDMGGECRVSATRLEQSGEMTGEVICFDLELSVLRDQPERVNEEFVAGMECGVEDELSRSLSEATGEEVICTDQDGDCFYACSGGWVLNNVFHDPDDQRSFIPGRDVEDPIVAPSQSSEEVLACQSFAEEGIGEYGYCCPVSAESGAATACLRELNRDAEEEIEALQTCHHGGVTWVGGRESGMRTLYFGTLASQDNVQAPSDLSAPSISMILSSEVDRVTHLVCQLEDGKVRGMFADATGGLYLFGQDRRGAYIAEPFYTSDVLIDGVPIGELDMDIQQLKLDGHGLFYWQISVVNDGEEKRYEDYSYGDFFASRRLQAIEGTPLDRTMVCSGCTSDDLAGELISATLDQNGEVYLEVTSWSDGSSQSLDLNVEGEVAELFSSQEMLGMTSSLQGGVGLRERVYFNFWRSRELRDQLLTFEASLWGFEGVEVISLIGSQGLLKLYIDPQTSVLGLYDVLSDRLKMVDVAQLTAGVMDEVNVAELKDPVLRGDRLIWLLEGWDNNPLSQAIFSVGLTFGIE